MLISVSEDRSTCEITGEAGTVQAGADYIITARNVRGEGSATVQLSIVAPPPRLPADLLANGKQCVTGSEANCLINFEALNMTEGGGVFNSNCTITGLPTGFGTVIGSTSCRITDVGTVTAGNYELMVTLTNATASRTFTISLRVCLAANLNPAFDCVTQDGTASKPYLIETVTQLDAVRNSLSSHYRLVSDIDLMSHIDANGNGMIDTKTETVTETVGSKTVTVLDTGNGKDRSWEPIGDSSNVQLNLQVFLMAMVM